MLLKRPCHFIKRHTTQWFLFYTTRTLVIRKKKIFFFNLQNGVRKSLLEYIFLWVIIYTIYSPPCENSDKLLISSTIVIETWMWWQLQNTTFFSVTLVLALNVSLIERITFYKITRWIKFSNTNFTTFVPVHFVTYVHIAGACLTQLFLLKPECEKTTNIKMLGEHLSSLSNIKIVGHYPANIWK